MIRTVSDLRRALDAYPDDMPVGIYCKEFSDYRPPFVWSEQEVYRCNIENTFKRSELEALERNS